MKYYKIEDFIDESGRVIKKRTLMNSEEKEISYMGFAMIRIASHPSAPPMTQPLEFTFPDTITNIEEAFTKFDEFANIEVEKFKEKMMKMQQEQSKQIILPNQAQSQKGNIPFPN